MRGRQNNIQDGYALFAAMLVLAIVTVWIANSALATGYGVLAAASTRDRLNARIAANERAAGAVPEGTGGSVWPATPVVGFFDHLLVDATGRLVVISEAEIPPSGEVVLRQWRLAPNAPGGRVLDVSAVIVDASTRHAVAPPRGAEFRRTLIVE